MRNDLATLLSELAIRWSGLNVARPGASRRDIEQVERRYGIRLPDELASLFLTADGMDEEETDDLMIRFWPVNELKPVGDEIPAEHHSAYEGFFLFADYSLWTHGYAIKINDSTDAGTVAMVGGPRPTPVAPSFLKFVENYLRHPDRLFL